MAHETRVKGRDTSGFRAVLVPLDGSATGEQALPVAAGLAQCAGATLHLAMAYEPPSALALSSELPRVASELDREGRSRAREYVEGQADAARRAYGLAAAPALLEGPPAGALAEHVRAQRIDLVVMTTHGRGGLSRWWLGSVADRLLRRTTVPVLLLHPRKRPHRTEFRRILVALDGERDEPVVESALTLGSLGPAPRYLLARIVPPSAPIMSPLPAYPIHPRPDWARRRELEARTALARLAAPLEERGIAVGTEVVAAEAVAETVLRIARTESADLIVVGTHGATGAERLILGSVADKVIRGATRPVLVVPPRRE